jgi:type VI secretion system secreted protein Hcp
MAEGGRSSSIKIDGFLKVPDIPGPSERDGHEEEIEIHGVKFNMHAPHDPNSMSRRGRVALDMIVFTKYYDMPSPYLKKALFDNTPMDEVVFSARRTIEGETSDYLVVTLTDASVMTYQMCQAPDEADLIEEEVGFAYNAIKFVYDKDHEIEMSVKVGK